jgi:hypothetical protein
MIYRRLLSALIILGALTPWTSYAGQAAIEISPRTSTPGATVVLSGKGLGQFKSVQFNKVTFAGMPALIQRWESDLVEVKVPFKAATGPVEMMIGKKKLSAGTFTVVKPRIESITPTEAERGTMVTITGEHFGATAGARDPNTMFGVNDVVIGGVVVRPRRWKDDKIEVDPDECGAWGCRRGWRHPTRWPMGPAAPVGICDEHAVRSLVPSRSDDRAGRDEGGVVRSGFRDQGG